MFRNMAGLAAVYWFADFFETNGRGLENFKPRRRGGGLELPFEILIGRHSMDVF